MRLNDFTRNFATLFSGSFVAQAILFGITLILTRIYSEEQFGIFSLYTTIVLVLQTVISLRFELSILLPDNHRDAALLTLLTIVIVTILSLLTLIVAITLNQQISILLDSKQIGSFLYFVPLSILMGGIYEAFSYWNNRMKRFNRIAVSKIVKSTTTGSGQLVLGYSTLNHIGLIAGLITGQIANTIYIFTVSIKSLRKYLSDVNLNDVKQLAIYYKDIPVFNTIIASINNTSNQLPVLLLTRYFGLATTGYFGLANRVVRTPIDLICQSIGLVFFNKASDTVNNKGNLFQLIKSTYFWLALTSSIPFVALYFITYYFDFIFGSQWLEVGIYTRILIPFLYLGFLNASVSSVVVVLNKQRTILVYDILLLICRFFALFAGYYFYNSAIASIAFFSAAGVLFNAFLLFYFLSITKNNSYDTDSD